MGKFLLGLLTGLLLVFLTLVLIFFAAWRFRDRPPDIADNSVLVLRLEGEIPEKPPVEMPAFLVGDHPGLTVTGFWMTLRKAAADSHVKAVVLEPERLSAGCARSPTCPRPWSSRAPPNGRPTRASRGRSRRRCRPTGSDRKSTRLNSSHLGIS